MTVFGHVTGMWIICVSIKVRTDLVPPTAYLHFTFTLKNHPGTEIYVTNRFGGWSSLENMWYQVQQLGEDMMNITKLYPDGIHLLGKD